MTGSELATFAKALARVLGWTYFMLWSFSFYPQPLLNYKRRTTSGCEIDFPFLNTLGFTAYTVSCGAFLFSTTIQSQYAYRNPVSPESTVRINDFVFALHGTILCIITYSQFWLKSWGFNEERRWASRGVMLGIWFGCILGVLATAGLVAFSIGSGQDPRHWAWIDLIYAISYVKIIITIAKYIPQAWANYQRKSTVGWSIDQILYDFSGGILSIAQLLIDSALQADWSGVTGNPVKFLLANVTIFFDIVFLVQHYWLYRGPRSIDASDESILERQPLLRNQVAT